MKLNYRHTFFIGLAFMSISAFWQLYDTIVPLILQNTFKLGETLTGGIMAADNILSLFLLPLFGSISDKIDTRFGKRIPFILGGTIAAVISMMIIPYANENKNFLLFFFSLGFVLIAMGTYRSPAVALMPDLTPKPLRSKANAIINLMGAIGGIITLIIISLLLSKEIEPNYTNIFLAVGILMISSIIILVANIDEKKISKEMKISEEEILEDVVSESITREDKIPKDVKRSLYFLLISILLWFMAYNAIMTTFSRYATKIWGMKGGGFANALMIATSAAILSYIPIGILSSNIGRKRTIIIGILTMSLSYFFGSLFTIYSPIINIVFAFTGIGWAAINVNSYPMVVEMSNNSNIGKYTGLYYTFSMTAQIFTPILSGFLLENISYRILFPYATIFSLLSLCTMLFVHHGDTKPLKKIDPLEYLDLND